MRIQCPDSRVLIDLPDDGPDEMKFRCPACGQTHRVATAPAGETPESPTGPVVTTVQTPDADAYTPARVAPVSGAADPLRPDLRAPQGKTLKNTRLLRTVLVAAAAPLLLAALVIGFLHYRARTRDHHIALLLRSASAALDRGNLQEAGRQLASSDDLFNTRDDLNAVYLTGNRRQLRRQLDELHEHAERLTDLQHQLDTLQDNGAGDPAAAGDESLLGLARVIRFHRDERLRLRDAGQRCDHQSFCRLLVREIDRRLAATVEALAERHAGAFVAPDPAGPFSLAEAADYARDLARHDALLRRALGSVAAAFAHDDADAAHTGQPPAPLSSEDRLHGLASFPACRAALALQWSALSERLREEIPALHPRVLRLLDADAVEEALEAPSRLARALSVQPGNVAEPALRELTRIMDAFTLPVFADTPDDAETGEDAPPAALDAFFDNIPGALASWEAVAVENRPLTRSEELGHFYRLFGAIRSARFQAGGRVPGLAPLDNPPETLAAARDRTVNRALEFLARVLPANAHPWLFGYPDIIKRRFDERFQATQALRHRMLARVRQGPGATPESRADHAAAAVLFRLLRNGPGAGGMTIAAPDAAQASGADGVTLHLRIGRTPAQIVIPPNDVEKRLVVLVNGYRFRIDWTHLFRNNLLWMAELARALRAAGVNHTLYPEWDVVEGPGIPLALSSGLVAALPLRHPADARPDPDAGEEAGDGVHPERSGKNDRKLYDFERDERLDATENLRADSRTVDRVLEQLHLDAPIPARVFSARETTPGHQPWPATVLPHPNQDELENFRAAAALLRAGVAEDETIPANIRQALDPVLNATYGTLDPRDYLDGDFARRLIEGDYLERAVPELAADRRRELAAFRAALSRLEAGRADFRYETPADGGRPARRVHALRQLEGDLDQRTDTNSLDDIPIPAWTWRVTDGSRTEFVGPFPERVSHGWMLAEIHYGTLESRPKGLPRISEVRHLTAGVLATFRSGDLTGLLSNRPGAPTPVLDAPASPDDHRLTTRLTTRLAPSDALNRPGDDPHFGEESHEKWNQALARDRAGFADGPYGPPGWGFPPHIPVRNHEGDVLALAVPGGWLESPDFTNLPESERPDAMDAWLDRAAALLDTPGQLSLLFRQFARYTLDSPIPERPNMLGSADASGDDHQTAHQFLARRVMNRLIGDCDDLAEFFQNLVERQGKLAFVMSLPQHAAAGYADRPAPGSNDPWRFVILQTGPAMRFEGDSLEDVVERAYTSFDPEGSQSQFSTAQVPLLLRFAGEQTRTPFILAARIYGDRDYAEKMVHVQGLWHENVYSAAVRVMEEMVKTDNDVGNLKELASLYERIGYFEESARMRETELSATGADDGDTNIRLSTLLEIAQLHHQAKNRPETLAALDRIANTFRDFARNHDFTAYIRGTGFRLATASMYAAIGEPLRAWDLLGIDLANTRKAISRGASGDEPATLLGFARVFTSIYEAFQDQAARDPETARDPRFDEARREAAEFLGLVYSRDFFRPGDSFVNQLVKYSLLGDYAIARAGRAAGIEKLLDGPGPDAPRPHHLHRKDRVTDADWEWLRVVPMLYIRQGLERLDPEEKPELFDPATARRLLAAAPDALARGAKFGAMNIAQDDVFTARIVLALLDGDLEGFRAVMDEVRAIDYSRYYDQAAMAFGAYSGLVPMAAFDGFVDAFHAGVPGQQHYFKVVYRAIDKEYFAHARAMARATARFFPDEQLLVEEAEHIEKLVPELERRVAARRAAAGKTGTERKNNQ